MIGPDPYIGDDVVPIVTPDTPSIDTADPEPVDDPTDEDDDDDDVAAASASASASAAERSDKPDAIDIDPPVEPP